VPHCMGSGPVFTRILSASSAPTSACQLTCEHQNCLMKDFLSHATQPKISRRLSHNFFRPAHGYATIFAAGRLTEIGGLIKSVRTACVQCSMFIRCME
jgi:hypothetical protein